MAAQSDWTLSGERRSWPEPQSKWWSRLLTAETKTRRTSESMLALSLASFLLADASPLWLASEFLGQLWRKPVVGLEQWIGDRKATSEKLPSVC